MTLPLIEAGDAEVLADGTATVSLTVPLGTTWEVSSCTVSCSVEAPMPTARVYRADVNPANLLGGTYAGALDTATQAPGHVFGPGQRIVAHWIGAAPGAFCTFTVAGVVK